jgi:hypothetical protein
VPQQSRLCLGVLLGVALVLLAIARVSPGVRAWSREVPAAAAVAVLRCDLPAHVLLAAADASLERHLRRWITRTERLGGRILQAAGGIVGLLLWLVGSSVVFLVVAAAGAAAEGAVMRRLVSDTPGALRSLWLGMRVFAGAVIDRSLLLVPRLILVAGWCYWLLPSDLFAEEAMLLAYVDDVLVAVGVGKLFLVFCPQAVLEEQAEQLLTGRRKTA